MILYYNNGNKYIKGVDCMQYLVLLVGFICLIKGADLFVEGSSSVAKKFHIPSMIIGLTIVAIGTSAPEASVSITSALVGQNDICIANVVGSNIFNILMVLGISSMIYKLPVKESTIKKDIPVLIGACISTLIFSINNYFSMFEGLILLSLFTWYIYSLIKESKNSTEEEVLNDLSTFKTVLYIGIGMTGIILGGNLTVDAASMIAAQLGLSQNLIGLTVVALGTSLPEFVTSVTATRKGEVDIAIGNVIGSNIFNILLVLGASSMICPLYISIESIIDVLFMTTITIIIWLFIKKDKIINNKHGLIFVMLYIGYLIYTIIR